MCGLFFACNAKLGLSKLRAINSLMHHRGPDSCDDYYKPPYYMGFNRLSILDLSARANQPFVSRSGKHVIAFNGEIYNYRELVQKHGLRMRTSGDTELLVELYEKLGAPFLNELNGMFAFVILNPETGDVFAARDRLGVKPLYFFSENETLAFASELAPLLDTCENTEVDDIGLRQYTLMRTFFNGHTLYKKIRSFPAGHYYLNGRLVRYWSLPEPKEAPPDDDALRALIESSIAYRQIADVPIAAFLSGGLDSTLIALLGKPDSTWSIGFAQSNEFEWAERAALAAGTRHRNIIVTESEFIETARAMILSRREPLSVPNEVLLYLMAREIKKETKVVLCGEGADELFFGYDRIFRWAAQQERIDPLAFEKIYAYGTRSDPEIINYALEPFIKTYRTPLNIVSAFFLTSHLQGLLRRLDNGTMHASVEAREPFVDFRLVEALFGIGLDYKMHDGVVKAPLKRIFRSILPKEISERPKVGFPVPLEKIFQCENRDLGFDAWFNFNLRTLGLKEGSG